MARKRDRDLFYMLRDRVIKMKESFETKENQISVKYRFKSFDYPSLFPSQIKRGRRSFKSDEQFYDYLKKLKSIVKYGYDREGVRRYKQNFLKTIERIYGEAIKGNAVYDIKQKVNHMKAVDFIGLLRSGKIPDISYLYADKSEDYDSKLFSILEGLGIET